MDYPTIIAFSADAAIFCIGFYVFFFQKRLGRLLAMLLALFLGAIICNTI